MGHDYKLTSIVLVYNGEPLLEECLDSLVNQTLDGLEILLINDASTDNSLEICRRYERDYENVFVIDKPKNEGLATSANLGISMAKGEYVILVDNDDIVPATAYEKLYSEAKSNGSDICIGKANFLTYGNQFEMNYLETYVWHERRTISNVEEFPEIFHDAFYWNKIMRKEFLMEHDIKLPTGMIYADRNFSHKAYVNAERISIIPDCVYLWRIRRDSLSMKKAKLDNYINRIDSYEIGLDEITDAYPEYFKKLLRRVFIPIRGLLDDEEFEEFLFTRVRDLILRQMELMGDVYDNDLTGEFNIFLYLIINDDRKNLKSFLESDYNDISDVFDENGKSYWKIFQFRNPDYGIPDEFFEIKYLESQFVKVGEVSSTGDSIVFNKIKIPENYGLNTAQIIFKGRAEAHDVYEDNWISVEVKSESDGTYRAEIPQDALKPFIPYDIFFRASRQNMIPNEFRMTEKNISGISNGNKNIQIRYLGNKSLEIMRFKGISASIRKLKNKIRKNLRG